jgi:hypothetical protein
MPGLLLCLHGSSSAGQTSVAPPVELSTAARGSESSTRSNGRRMRLRGSTGRSAARDRRSARGLHRRCGATGPGSPCGRAARGRRARTGRRQGTGGRRSSTSRGSGSSASCDDAPGAVGSGPARAHGGSTGRGRATTARRARASILHASGARPLTFWASATKTSQPSSSRRGRGRTRLRVRPSRPTRPRVKQSNIGTAICRKGGANGWAMTQAGYMGRIHHRDVAVARSADRSIVRADRPERAAAVR